MAVDTYILFALTTFVVVFVPGPAAITITTQGPEMVYSVHSVESSASLAQMQFILHFLQLALRPLLSLLASCLMRLNGWVWRTWFIWV